MESLEIIDKFCSGPLAIFPNMAYQDLRTPFHIEGAQIFQKGATSRLFEAT